MGKCPPNSHTFTFLDVRAVRGPHTRGFLQDRGINVPEIFGDPALLLPHVAPELLNAAQHKRHKVTIVPNMEDLRLHRSLRLVPNVLNPRSGLRRCLYRIVRSELVVGSSLHAIIVAEAFGIPARVVESKVEHHFKYADYYAGNGPRVVLASADDPGSHPGGRRAIAAESCRCGRSWTRSRPTCGSNSSAPCGIPPRLRWSRSRRGIPGCVPPVAIVWPCPLPVDSYVAVIPRGLAATHQL